MGKGGYEEINLESAKRNLQSNFYNSNATEICLEEQGRDDVCISNPNPLEPNEPEQSNATKICMENLEQRMTIGLTMALQ